MEGGRWIRSGVGVAHRPGAIDEEDTATLNQAKEDLVEGELLKDRPVGIGGHRKGQPQPLRVAARLRRYPRPDHQDVRAQPPDLLIRARQPAGVRPTLQSGEGPDEEQDDGPPPIIAQADGPARAAHQREQRRGQVQLDGLGRHGSRSSSLRVSPQRRSPPPQVEWQYPDR